MKEFFKSRAFKAIILIFVVFLGIMAGNAVSGRGFSFPSSIVNTITAPFLEISAIFKNGVGGVGDYFQNQQDLIKENELLKNQITETRSQLAEYRQAILDNEMYRDMLGLKQQRPDFNMVGALVISFGSGEYYGTFTINKGTLDGIKKSDAVVTADGIIGKVSEAGLNYSKITTILSPDTNIGGYDTGSRSFGVLSNTPELSRQGLFMLSYLPKESVVTVGSIIITSGQGSLYPPGLIAGTVRRVSPDEQGVAQNAVLTPAANFEGLKEVLVITDFDPAAHIISSEPEVQSDSQSQTSGTDENPDGR